MAKHLQTGEYGEKLALELIQNMGWPVLSKNWRHGHLELDLVALDGEILVFIEVKTRRSLYYGTPETFVTPAKQRKLWQAAEAYMIQHNHQWEIRFDIIAIHLSSRQLPAIRHYRDAFWPGWND
ncbi:MAG: YraN family protein [Lewinellaceae bacterium]|nr:YraN family protein [Lewinellaceae bacterium]